VAPGVFDTLGILLHGRDFTRADRTPTVAAVAALFFVVAVVDCYIPARRAMRVDPVVALRAE
jgi:ABC-type lipoprotein release transport system permease subunit